jgi:hypothetical protein
MLEPTGTHVVVVRTEATKQIPLLVHSPGMTT